MLPSILVHVINYSVGKQSIFSEIWFSSFHFFSRLQNIIETVGSLQFLFVCTALCFNYSHFVAANQWLFLAILKINLKGNGMSQTTERI